MKIFTGKVVSTKLNKTAAVLVTRVVMHPIYLKRYKKDRKYLVHDEIGAKEGDTVQFVATKPISKLKKWKVTKVVGAKKNVVRKEEENK